MANKYHKKYNKFYSSRRWIALRNYIRTRDKVCVKCREKGVISQGYEVHHIKDIEHYPELALDEDNLELLCKSCHDLQHDRTSAFYKFMMNRR